MLAASYDGKEDDRQREQHIGQRPVQKPSLFLFKQFHPAQYA